MTRLDPTATLEEVIDHFNALDSWVDMLLGQIDTLERKVAAMEQKITSLTNLQNPGLPPVAVAELADWARGVLAGKDARVGVGRVLEIAAAVLSEQEVKGLAHAYRDALSWSDVGIALNTTEDEARIFVLSTLKKCTGAS